MVLLHRRGCNRSTYIPIHISGVSVVNVSKELLK